jgi:hypothetical protein
VTSPDVAKALVEEMDWYLLGKKNMRLKIAKDPENGTEGLKRICSRGYKKLKNNKNSSEQKVDNLEQKESKKRKVKIFLKTIKEIFERRN